MRVVIQKKPFRGNPVGSVVDVSRRDARVLTAVGLATIYAEPEQQAPEPESEPDAPVDPATGAEPSSAEVSDPQPEQQEAAHKAAKKATKRTYKRRDLQAE